MAWSDLSLKGHYLDGIDTTTFGHLQAQTIAGNEETDESRRLVTARQKLKLALQGPRTLGPFAATYGLASFFDDLQASSDLAEELQLALAYSYAWLRYTHDSVSPGDIDEVRAERMETLFKSALDALSQSVPVILGASDKPSGQAYVSAIAGAMDTRGNTSFNDSDAGC